MTVTMLSSGDQPRLLPSPHAPSCRLHKAGALGQLASPPGPWCVLSKEPPKKGAWSLFLPSCLSHWHLSLSLPLKMLIVFLLLFSKCSVIPPVLNALAPNAFLLLTTLQTHSCDYHQWNLKITRLLNAAFVFLLLAFPQFSVALFT